MQRITLHCTGIGLWEVTGHRFVTKAALEDSKGPSRGHEDGRAATCDGALGRPCCASYVECPLMAALKACAPAALYWGMHEINKTVTFS